MKMKKIPLDLVYNSLRNYINNYNNYMEPLLRRYNNRNNNK